MWPLLRLWVESKDTLRIVCLIVVAGWLLGIGMFVLVAVGVFTRDVAVVSFLFSRAALTALVLSGGVIAVANFWLLFPRCARCSKLLFDDGSRTLMRDHKPDIRHHRAKTFMNSYFRGAVLGLATTGRLICSRCGHELGKKPDYVVIAPE